MIKRTLLFSNPAYLSTKNEQLVVAYPEEDKPEKTVPIEDIGVVVLENRQVTISNALLDKLLNNKVAVVSCDEKHMPVGLMMPLNAHTEHNERIRHQLKASKPLNKNLWQQTVVAKIENQLALLKERGIPIQKMEYLSKNVQSGDKTNAEGQAAAYYWQHLFEIEGFTREQYGLPPNNLLNYGYAILRAIVARALVSSGLLPVLGIFHCNKYNAYCLADDMMEPYRPYVDLIVCHLIESHDSDQWQLTPAMKAELLSIASIDVEIEGKISPLFVGVSRTTHSLYECYAGVSRKLIFPRYG